MKTIKNFCKKITLPAVIITFSIIVVTLGMAAVVLQKPAALPVYVMGLLSGVILTIIWVEFEDTENG